MRMSIFRKADMPEEAKRIAVVMEKYKNSKIAVNPNEILVDLQKLLDHHTENPEKREKRFNLIHYAFKANLFTPAMYWLRRKLGKNLVNNKHDIPNEPWNENFRLLMDTYEEAYAEWVVKFQSGRFVSKLYENKIISEDVYNDLRERNIEVIPDDLVEKLLSEGKLNVIKETNCYIVPKFMIQLALTVVLEDTAYRELTNFFLFRLQGNMNKKYKPDVEHKFPLYTVMYDNYIPYFMEWIKLKGGATFQIAVSGGGEANINIDKSQIDNFFKMTEEQYIAILAQSVKEKVNVMLQEVIKNEFSKDKGGTCPSIATGDNAGDKGKTSGIPKETGNVSGSISDKDSKADKA